MHASRPTSSCRTRAVHEELARSQVLQNDVWAQAVAAIQSPGSGAEAKMLLMPALNQMFDLATVRLSATQMHPPQIIYVMLIGLALASALLAGYQSAADRTPARLHPFGFAAIVAITVYVTVEIEYPRLGWIRIDTIDQLLIEVRDSR